MKNRFMAIIPVKDLDESIAFYQKHLRCLLIKRIAPAPGVEIAFLLYHDAVEFELIRRPNELPVKHEGAGPILAFQTDDLESAYEALSKDDVCCEGPPDRLPSGARILRFTDPNGTRLSLMEE